MTISRVRQGGASYSIIATEAVAAETAEGTLGSTNLSEALALTEAYVETGSFIYSATAEGNGGEVADPATAADMDDEPGLIYSGPSGRQFHLTFANIDITEGTIAPEATDTVTVGIAVNNKAVLLADEGYVALTAETIHEMNGEAGVYVNLNESDVVRLMLLGSGSEVIDTDIAVGGSVIISG